MLHLIAKKKTKKLRFNNTIQAKYEKFINLMSTYQRNFFYFLLQKFSNAYIYLVDCINSSKNL